MADVNDIICLGYGPWSGVAMLPTLGFGISVVAEPPTRPGVEATLPLSRMHYQLPVNRPHYTLPINRIHYEVPHED